MSEQFISYEMKDGVAYLTLNRPPVNVIDIATLRQMRTALAELAQDSSVRTLVLQAEGRMFSAGVDVADHTADKVGEMIPLVDQVCRDLAEFPLPTIAAVHGHALGGGCELVICCDMAVMVESAKIGQPEIQLAVFAPIAAMRLPFLVGYSAAADILFTGRNLSAQEALRIGLVNAVVSQEELSQWVEEKVGQLSGLSRSALLYCKQALNLGFGNWSRVHKDMERLYLDDLMRTADANEGLAAFMEKRRPVWQHA